jgi:hypothetical protein
MMDRGGFVERERPSDLPHAEHFQRTNSSWQQLIARAQMRQSNSHFSPSRRPGTDDRVPEERSNKSHQNNAKDWTHRVGA